MPDEQLPDLATLAKLKRLSQIEGLRLEGVPQSQIAVRLGVSTATVSVSMAEIYERWRNEDGRLREKKAEAVAVLRHLYQQAMSAWRTSQDVVELRSCPNCKDGLADEDGRWCETCDGTGVVREVSKVPGDPKHLRNALDARKELHRLQGIGEKTERRGDQLGILPPVGGQSAIDWERVPSDVLLQVKAALDLAAGRGRIIEVDAGR